MPGLTLTHDLRVRMSRVQFEMLKSKAQLSGFSTIADYVRYILIENPFVFERMIKEMYEIIVKKKNQSPASDRTRLRRKNSSSETSPDANFWANNAAGEDGTLT